MIYLAFIFEEDCCPYRKYCFKSESARKEWLDSLSGSRVNMSNIILIDELTVTGG